MPTNPPLDLSPELSGYTLIGVDEVGTGALAGPVAACACILDPHDPFVQENARDSKQYTGKKARALRQLHAAEFRRRALFAMVMAEEVEGVHTRAAANRAMAAAVQWVAAAYQACRPRDRPLLVVVDGDFRLPLDGLPQQSFVRGDQHFLVIGAASTIAKDWRDTLMTRFEETYPGYGFAQNAGYGTHQHQTAIARLGVCPVHRAAIVSSMLSRQGL